MTTVQIASEFGYIVLVVVLSWVVLNWMALQVVKARKKYEIPYPTMYSSQDTPEGHQFNCIQRAHQNTLEVIPVFLVLLIFGGLQYPRLCALCGMLWIFSRIVYAKGYYSGDPAKRNRGAFGYIGLLTLLASTISFALHLLGWM